MNIGATPRPYQDADQAGVLGLWEACGLSRPWNDPLETIAGFTAGDHTRLYVADNGAGEILGSVAVGDDGNRGWLYRLAVSPEVRGGGVARGLVTEAKNWLASRGVVKVQVLIRAGNNDARGFYARAGFHASDVGMMQCWLKPPAENEFPAADSETLNIVITHMEMVALPKRRTFARPRGSLALLEAKAPTVSFYRYLYDAVGATWLWADRQSMSDAALEKLLGGDDVSLRVLYVDGVPAGFAELDHTQLASEGCLTLRHIGLMPSFIGRGYGRYLLTWVIDAAWQLQPMRIETAVRSLDHPHGVALLQQYGFTVVSQEARDVTDPRRSGLIDPRLALPSKHIAPEPNERSSDGVVTPLFPRK